MKFFLKKCSVIFVKIWTLKYFPLFSLNAGKYGPEKTPYLDTFHEVHYCDINPFLANSP